MVNGESPVKRHRHDRNRHDLKRLHKVSNMNNSNRSLFDDESNENDDIFSFNINTTLNAGQSEGRSFLSLEPTKSNGAFDFNSYLKEVTSEIKIDSRKTPALTFTRKEDSPILNFQKGKRLDLINDRSIITRDNLLDEWELDCVVRASEYDSDSEMKSLNEENDFGINFSQLAESQERKSHDILNLEQELSTPVPKKNIMSKSDLSFDPTLSLSSKPAFSIFSDNLKSPESPLAEKQPSTPSTPLQHSKISICSPHHRTLRSPAKSNFKPILKNLLNMIVQSSDGDIDEAVKFATEINSINIADIPIPQKTTELVHIPTNGPPDSSGNKRSALITGVRPKVGKRKLQFHLNDKENSSPRRFSHHLSQRRGLKDSSNTSHDARARGFYSPNEKSDFLSKKKEPNSNGITKNQTKVGVRWADDLEW